MAFVVAYFNATIPFTNIIIHEFKNLIKLLTEFLKLNYRRNKISLLDSEQNRIKVKRIQEKRTRKFKRRTDLFIYSTNFAKNPSTFKKFSYKIGQL